MKPRLVSSIIIKKDNKLLLVKEKQNDNREWWVFPGGGVEFGETLEDAALREIKEELGLDVEIKEFLGFKEVIFPKHEYHTIVFFFIADPLDGEINKIDEILDVGYFTAEEIKNLDLVGSAKWVMEELNKKSII
jgi:8-oxo-dGTP diphosphatase